MVSSNCSYFKKYLFITYYNNKCNRFAPSRVFMYFYVILMGTLCQSWLGNEFGTPHERYLRNSSLTTSCKGEGALHFRRWRSQCMLNLADSISRLRILVKDILYNSYLIFRGSIPAASCRNVLFLFFEMQFLVVYINQVCTRIL